MSSSGHGLALQIFTVAKLQKIKTPSFVALLESRYDLIRMILNLRYDFCLLKPFQQDYYQFSSKSSLFRARKRFNVTGREFNKFYESYRRNLCAHDQRKKL